MKEIDKNKIIDKLNVIYSSLSKLKNLSTLSEEDFLSDFKYYDSAKYNLIQCIEAIIDISNHIIARKKLGNPKTYSETFEILGKNNIIPENYVKNYKKMAKFRNLLVHFYAEVKDTEVYKILKENLEDIEQFTKIIEELI